jgi:hypothetical protein
MPFNLSFAFGDLCEGGPSVRQRRRSLWPGSCPILELNRRFSGAGLCSANFNIRTGCARDRFDKVKRPVAVMAADALKRDPLRIANRLSLRCGRKCGSGRICQMIIGLGQLAPPAEDSRQLSRALNIDSLPYHGGPNHLRWDNHDKKRPHGSLSAHECGRSRHVPALAHDELGDRVGVRGGAGRHHRLRTNSDWEVARSSKRTKRRIDRGSEVELGRSHKSRGNRPAQTSSAARASHLALVIERATAQRRRAPGRASLSSQCVAACGPRAAADGQDSTGWVPPRLLAAEELGVRDPSPLPDWDLLFAWMEQSLSGRPWSFEGRDL